MRRHVFLGLCAIGVASASCEDLHPMVAVRNGFDADSGIQVAGIRWNGCVWPEPLKPGETTAFHVCLPGQGRVFFLKFDPARPDLGWQGRKSATLYDLGAFRSCTIAVGPGEDERDTEAPGPYGH